MNSDYVHPDESQAEAMRLLSPDEAWTEMADLQQSNASKDQTRVATGYTDEEHIEESSTQDIATVDNDLPIDEPVDESVDYKVYKMRWFGLMQLVLLNIVVSWDWLSFSPVANTAATYFSTTPSVINWLSTAFLFAFVVASPPTIYALHAGGPRLAFIAASLFILSGNWIRYAGTRSSQPQYGVVMFGQILIGLAQPFVLAAPTHFSELWFSPRGRVSATALASLANPFGGALGQLINPFLCPRPDSIPSMTLYVALISSAATIPIIFLPAKPPTPSSPSSTTPRPTFPQTLRLLAKNPTFYLLLLPFSVFVGLFNALSSLLTQILTPYNFTETSSGIAGALLILVGLLAAAITSPIVDRSKAYLLLIKILVPITALSYLIFIWAPGTRGAAAPYAILSVLGAASFSLVPVGLEWLVEVTYPASPEAGSTICWAGGQLLGGVFIVISDALEAGEEASPPGNMGRALVFMAVVAIAAVVPAMLLGVVGRVNMGRRDVDKGIGNRG